MANAIRGAETRRHNTALTIDFDKGVTPEQLTTPARKVIRNVHVNRLYEILEAVEADKAEVGKLYVIGQFAAATGAKAARYAARQQEGEWPELRDGFTFELVAHRLGNGAGSELLAGVMSRE